MAQYCLPAGIDDVDSDDDDSVVAGVVLVVADVVSAAKAGAEKAELLQHAKKSCKARSAIVHAGAIPHQKGVVWWAS
jgi:hypothetical protein